MSLITTFVKGQRQKSRFTSKALRLMLLFLLIPLFFTSKSGLTEEKKNNTSRKNNTSSRLPPAPDTGSPEGDFSAGGTRDNHLNNIVCGEKSEKNIVYLLGNRNREFTSSAYPSFWFHLPNQGNNITQMKFVVREKETGKQIYDHVIQGAKHSGIIGITLPQEEKYALSPQVNYAWSLRVDCQGIGQESEIVLEGWITRLVSDSKLKKQLSAVSEVEKHAVYFKHNFLYDALAELAKHHINKPNNPQIEIAWNELLRELGWQDLIEQNYAINPSYIDTLICSKNIPRKQKSLSSAKITSRHQCN